MAYTAHVNLGNGLTWGVGHGILMEPRPVSSLVVIIPVNQLGELTNSEIGQAVRSMAREVKLIHAEHLADSYESEVKYRDTRLEAHQKVEVNKAGFVYLLQGGNYYKIGHSKDVPTRLSQISPKLPFPTQVIHTIKTDDMAELEKALHKRFKDKRTNGEWFVLNDADVAWIMGGGREA